METKEERDPARLKEKVDPNTAKILECYKNPDVPKFYANGFQMTIGTGDVTILLEKGEQPEVLLNISYTLAKTLAEKLTGLIKLIEQRSNQSIMTTDDMYQLIKES